MAKKQIEVILETDEEVIKNNTLAIITDNVIKYNDNNVLVILKISDSEVIITRENNEYQLTLKFKKDKKLIGNYLLKENNINLKLEILTEKLIISENKIEIVYILNDEIRKYKLFIRE